MMHWVRLPSGHLVNLATMTDIQRVGDYTRVSFCAAGALEVGGGGGVSLATLDLIGDDARALIAFVVREVRL